MARKKINISQIGMKVVGTSVGAVGAKFLNNKIAPKLNPKIKAAAILAVGALLPTLQPRNTFIGDAADGMVAIGATELLGEMVPALAGIGEMDDDLDDDLDDYYIDEDYLYGTDEYGQEGGVGNIEDEGGVGNIEDEGGIGSTS